MHLKTDIVTAVMHGPPIHVATVSTITPTSNPFLRDWETCVFWALGTSSVVRYGSADPTLNHELVVAAVRCGDLAPPKEKEDDE